MMLLAGLVAGALTMNAWTGRVDAQPPSSVNGLETNIDRPGSDYRSFWMVSQDPLACQAVCNRDRRCAAFTFVRAGVQGPQARCYLKDPPPAPVGNNCCVSGLAGGTHERGFDRPGGDYRNFPMPSGGANACRAACRIDGRCRAYTYVDAGVQGPQPRCWLKDQVPDPVANARTTSGVLG